MHLKLSYKKVRQRHYYYCHYEGSNAVVSTSESQAVSYFSVPLLNILTNALANKEELL